MLHPSSTPKVEGSNGRRFLLWNLTGMVLSRDEQARELRPFSTPTPSPELRPSSALTCALACGSRREQTYSAIEVDFNNTEQHRTLRLTDHYNFSMAALDDAAVVFGAKSSNGNPSTVVYRPLLSWAPNSEWQVQLEKGEEALAVAVSAAAPPLRHHRALPSPPPPV